MAILILILLGPGFKTLRLRYCQNYSGQNTGLFIQFKDLLKLRMSEKCRNKNNNNHNHNNSDNPLASVAPSRERLGMEGFVIECSQLPC